MQDQGDIDAAERRIAAALERIGRGLERLGKGPAGDAALAEALAAERDAHAQTTERLRVVRARDTGAAAALESRVEELTRQLEAQGIELQRLRKTVLRLRETLRTQREPAAQGAPEANRALLAEIDALRALRLTETAEIAALLAEIDRLAAAPPAAEHADA